MDLHELEYVMAIAREQNITKAANALYVSQSAVSKFLKALESDLGLHLFRKLGNKYVLTYAGECYIQRAKAILNIKKDLDIEMLDIIKKDIGLLRVAFPTMRCSYMLPYTLTNFHKMHPNVKVDIKEGHSDDLDLMILDGVAEIAFYTKPIGAINPLLEYEILGDEELLICTAHEHPISHYAKPNPASPYPKLELAMLEKEQIIMMLPTQRTGQIMDNYLHSIGLHFDNVIRTSNMSAIMELVAIGYGIAFIFEPHLRHRVVTVPIDCYSFGSPRMLSNFVAVYRKGCYLPSYAKDFINLTAKLYQKST